MRKRRSPKTPEDALRRALRLEKDTLPYYLAIPDVLGPNEIVDAMILAEKMHIAALMGRLFSGE